MDWGSLLVFYILELVLVFEKNLHQIPVESGDCAYIAAIDDSVKVTLDNNISQSSMSQPVSINDDSLTCDKLHSNQNLVPASKPSLHYATTLKSVQILSKF